MNSQRKQIRQSIASGKTFWFGGAQDALSALLVDQSDFDGVFTTGFGISASLLGQPDMEVYTLTENAALVNRIANVVKKPIFADADTGYGNVINVARTVREFEKAGAAAISLEDQISPKRCPAAAAVTPVVSLKDGIARIKAAVDARHDDDFVIVARTDVTDPSEAIDRAAHYAEAGADVVQPISRTFSSLEELKQLREATGRRLSLQLMAGTWMAALSREQIESVAAFASYPLITLMSTVDALQKNLAALAARRTGDAGDLPVGQVTMKEFKSVIGWAEMEERQAHYESN
ncbi:carboxyvinyl-carboxyphosphonate phosphorylmutase [Caballeronia hypogeia]|uniref:Carboxyvinyl-carboxyphosphonate phosphorylmutase n=1 Tax=Caballeronia hypogeia TaxID=1777140 RepID=A0A158D2Z7_9BURK|nr:isocitrate lyase/PEP mutase family protein [Caballeronia hypogeia]SAK88873.1 carboxyvinyl-carboxyphosphonate phosphorylmutase [Caballeronia hypogeia]